MGYPLLILCTTYLKLKARFYVEINAVFEMLLIFLIVNATLTTEVVKYGMKIPYLYSVFYWICYFVFSCVIKIVIRVTTSKFTECKCIVFIFIIMCK